MPSRSKAPTEGTRAFFQYACSVEWRARWLFLKEKATRHPAFALRQLERCFSRAQLHTGLRSRSLWRAQPFRDNTRGARPSRRPRRLPRGRFLRSAYREILLNQKLRHIPGTRQIQHHRAGKRFEPSDVYRRSSLAWDADGSQLFAQNCPRFLVSFQAKLYEGGSNFHNRVTFVCSDSQRRNQTLETPTGTVVY